MNNSLSNVNSNISIKFNYSYEYVHDIKTSSLNNNFKKDTPLFGEQTDNEYSEITENQQLNDNFITQGTEEGLKNIDIKFHHLKDENFTLRAELNQMKNQLNSINSINSRDTSYKN